MDIPMSKSHRNKSVLNQRICKSGQGHKGGEEHSRKKDHYIQIQAKAPNSMEVGETEMMGLKILKSQRG